VCRAVLIPTVASRILAAEVAWFDSIRLARKGEDIYKGRYEFAHRI